MDKLKIRPLNMEDFPLVEELYRVIQDIHADGRPDIFPHAEPALTVEQFRDLLEKPELALAVAAEWEGEPAGFLYAYWKNAPQSPFYCPRRAFYIDDVAVLPEFQHKGIARALMEHAKQKAMEAGADALELRVWAFNSYAREIYEKFGFGEQYRIMDMPLK